MKSLKEDESKIKKVFYTDGRRYHADRHRCENCLSAMPRIWMESLQPGQVGPWRSAIRILIKFNFIKEVYACRGAGLAFELQLLCQIVTGRYKICLSE